MPRVPSHPCSFIPARVQLAGCAVVVCVVGSAEGEARSVGAGALAALLRVALGRRRLGAGVGLRADLLDLRARGGGGTLPLDAEDQRLDLTEAGDPQPRDAAALPVEPFLPAVEADDGHRGGAVATLTAVDLGHLTEHGAPVALPGDGDPLAERREELPHPVAPRRLDHEALDQVRGHRGLALRARRGDREDVEGEGRPEELLPLAGDHEALEVLPEERHGRAVARVVSGEVRGVGDDDGDGGGVVGGGGAGVHGVLRGGVGGGGDVGGGDGGGALGHLVSVLPCEMESVFADSVVNLLSVRFVSVLFVSLTDTLFIPHGFANPNLLDLFLPTPTLAHTLLTRKFGTDLATRACARSTFPPHSRPCAGKAPKRRKALFSRK